MNDVKKNIKFQELHKKHLEAMGTDYRESLGELVQVKITNEPNVVEVHFSSGKWWHYDLNDGTWY